MLVELCALCLLTDCFTVKLVHWRVNFCQILSLQIYFLVLEFEYLQSTQLLPVF